MPRNQDSIKRYRIIHNKLKGGGKYSTLDILNACLSSGLSVKERTIQKDLQDLREDSTILGACLPIEKDNSTRTWYYSEIPKNIFPSLELEPQEVNALLFYAKMIVQYKEYSIFEEIADAVKKVLEGLNIPNPTKQLFESEAVLETEKHPSISGIEYIIELLDAISERKVIEINYTPFSGKSKNHKIKPLLLKEDKLMWYLVARNYKYDSNITFALDRINKLTITDEKFKKIDFDSLEYFKHSFGITVSNDEPIEVKIEFSPNQANYIKTLPIHSTQEILSDKKDGTVIKVLVKPSYEFYSKILSYGSGAKVISPDSVKKYILKELNSSLNRYNS